MSPHQESNNEKEKENNVNIQTNLESEARLAMSEAQTMYGGLGGVLSSKIIKIKKKRDYAIAPVALFGFAMTCFCLGLANVGLVRFSQFGMTVSIIFAGIMQYFMGIYSWRNGELIDSLLCIMYGQLNNCAFLWKVFPYFGWAPGYSGKSSGFFNIMWTLFMVPIVIVGLNGSKIGLTSTMLVFITNALNAAYGFTGNKTLQMIVGVDYIIISTLTTYIGFSILINGLFEKTILPLFAKGEKCWK